MQAALQYFPCLTNPVTAALEGCGRRLEEHLKLALDFYQQHEHTRKSYAQQTADHSSQRQYFNPRITLPNKLFASLKHILHPSLYLGIAYLSEKHCCKEKYPSGDLGSETPLGLNCICQASGLSQRKCSHALWSGV